MDTNLKTLIESIGFDGGDGDFYFMLGDIRLCVYSNYVEMYIFDRATADRYYNISMHDRQEHSDEEIIKWLKDSLFELRLLKDW